MKNIAVIYKSKYGTTKQYAKWVAQELNATLFESSAIKPSQLDEFDIVVYGGGLYAGGIDGVALVTKNPCKNLVVFTVGLADPKETDYTAILNKNFSPEMLPGIKVFHLRGGMDYKKLGLIHKGMMWLLRVMTVKKDESELIDEDRLFLETYNSKLDFLDMGSVAPVVDYVRESLM